ncbi:hypothetical protein Tsubulata_008692 [Turnera subulata]|uniref:RING-type E3 ubiquitin transferase BRCA1 n=1 Tax=Turnera subulata TaxID=218843 RepID=A0A9Q0F560_9ROSI|nr:hypothetical protein Tsubulata_008692 [Turnera subulata]
MERPVPGMESVVATVSGYHGTERFNLIKLISHSGASFVGAMSRSVTHLVCWRFEGRKYSLGKKFDAIIVNHRWVEECVKQGIRVPEHPYMMQSGEEVGPLLLQVPAAVDKLVSLNNSREALSDRSNSCDNSSRRVTDVSAWTDSFLLDQFCTSGQLQDLFPDVGKGRLRKYRAKSKQGESNSKRERKKVSWHEQSSSCSNVLQGKWRTDEIGSTSLDDPSHKMRRLVKKNVSRKNVETELLESDNEQCPTRVHEKQPDAAAAYKSADAERNAHTFERGGTSNATLNEDGNFASEIFDEIEEVRDWNLLSGSEHSSLFPEFAPTSLKRPDNEDSKGKAKDMGQCGPRSPTSLELSSCVICLTEFSPTRGILPCGHRFCYRCIQSWADHTASMRKLSTCPMCKASFDRIIRVEAADTSDQKIYSQTIPYTSSTTDIFFIEDQERCRSDAEVLFILV